MKKSKLIALTLTFIFILTACGEASSGYLFSTSQYINAIGHAVNDSGTIYIQNAPEDIQGPIYQKFEYLDFNSGETTVLCAKPGCVHDISDPTCHGNMDIDRTTVYMYFSTNEKFYYLKGRSSADRLMSFTELYESDFNRQNDRLVETFNGNPWFYIYAHEDSVYIITQEEIGYEPTVGSSPDNPVNFRVGIYDLKEQTKTGEIEMGGGYHADIRNTYGVYNNKLIYKVSYSETLIDWENVNSEEAGELMANFTTEYISLDKETLEVNRSEDLSELLGIDIEIDKIYYIIGDMIFYDTKGVLYGYDFKKSENQVIYDGIYSSVFKMGEKIHCNIDYGNNEAIEYDPSTRESRAVYRPFGGDWTFGHFLWREQGDYIYMDSSSQVGPAGEYEQGSPFIARVHKDDIYKEEYEAEIVS